MDTREQFEEASYRALLLAHGYLQDHGFQSETFYNMDGDFVVSVMVKDENNDEEVEYVATFERV